MAEKYRKAIIHYSKYQNAGIIETEACFKAARIAVEQNNSLHASSFLQNVIFINLTLSEQEKIQRFDTLAELYKDIGKKRLFFFTCRSKITLGVRPIYIDLKESAKFPKNLNRNFFLEILVLDRVDTIKIKRNRCLL